MLFLNICEVFPGHQSPCTALHLRGVLHLRAGFIPTSTESFLLCEEHPQASKLTSQDALTASRPLRSGFSLSFLECGGMWQGLSRTEVWEIITTFRLQTALASFSFGQPQSLSPSWAFKDQNIFSHRNRVMCGSGSPGEANSLSFIE